MADMYNIHVDIDPRWEDMDRRYVDTDHKLAEISKRHSDHKDTGLVDTDHRMIY